MSWYIRSQTKGRFIGFIDDSVYFENDEHAWNFQPMRFDSEEEAIGILNDVLLNQHDCNVVWEIDESIYLN